MPDNLFDLARSVPGLDFDEMDPLNLLAQTIERVGAVGQGKLSSAITQEDVNRWAGEIAGTVEGGRGSGWEAAEKIRSDILKWRVGQENLEVAFDMTPAQAAAAMEIGGDIAGTVMANAPTGEATFPGTINPYGYAPPQQEEDDSFSVGPLEKPLSTVEVDPEQKHPMGGYATDDGIYGAISVLAPLVDSYPDAKVAMDALQRLIKELNQ